jgi:FtsH-binding integral membrane protein
VARAIVFGIIVFAAATTTVTLLSIALVRLLTVYAFSGRVWASDFLIGAVFIAIGAIAWTLRSDRGEARSTK